MFLVKGELQEVFGAAVFALEALLKCLKSQNLKKQLFFSAFWWDTLGS